jgi:CHASE2 domain-containing sensor protein
VGWCAMPSRRFKFAHAAAKSLILLLILGPLLLELASDNLEAFNVASNKAWARFFQGAFWYQTVVKAGSRKPRDHYVRLVTLVRTREPDEIFDDMCKQRLFMAKLLAKIESARPAVIVIDKFYSPYSCRDPENEGNKRLLGSLRGSDVPIIIGLRTSDSNELDVQTPLSSSEKDAMRKASLVLEPSLRFNAGANVMYGLIRANRDTRRIPLGWEVFDDRASLTAGTPPHVLPTVARLAAEQFDPTIFSQSKLAGLLLRNAHPFASFLTESEIPTFTAIGLVCDPASPRPARWEDCRAGGSGNDLLRNHIVVIGNRTIDDFQASVIGTVPGAVLQANYIEALLDDRYFAPVNFWVAIIANSLLVLLIILLFYKAILPGTLPTDVALAGSFIGILLAWILVYVIALQFGYYLVIWFPGAVALVAMWAHGRAHGQTRPQPARTERENQEVHRG